MLVVKDIHTYYDTNYILQGVSLAVPAGKTVLVLGRNGVGKTTLIRTIVGTTPPRRGAVLFKDRDIAGLPPHRITSMGIALVPQGRRIFPSLSVRENLDLGVRGAGATQRAAWDLGRIFDLFPILRERQDQPGTTLSGGEQQMLACARALLANPELLLMDEPSEGLAPQKVRELGAVIDEMRQSGLAILLVEQKMTFAIQYADYVYILHKGEIGFEGPPDALLADTGVQERLLGVAPSAKDGGPESSTE
jgi:branched-chain amino acid transport system ATP-binding protein